MRPAHKYRLTLRIAPTRKKFMPGCQPLHEILYVEWRISGLFVFLLSLRLEHVDALPRLPSLSTESRRKSDGQNLTKILKCLITLFTFNYSKSPTNCYYT